MTTAVRSLLTFEPGRETLALLFICSHRNDGRRIINLTFASWDPDDGRGVVVHDFGRARANPTHTVDASGRTGFSARCPKCHRNPRRSNTLRQLIQEHGGPAEWRGDTLHAQTLDVSFMD